jgi:hypothetical protein
MNWYIGQEIVAIRDHSQGVFKKGDEFVIKGLGSPMCKCKEVVIDIGKKKLHYLWECPDCDVSYFKKSDTLWFSERSFAPKESTYSESEIEAVNVDELTEIITQPEYV